MAFTFFRIFILKLNFNSNEYTKAQKEKTSYCAARRETKTIVYPE
jgi:hypothetical protein